MRTTIVTDGLGFGMFIAVGTGHSHHLAPLGTEQIVQFSGRITIVVRVSRLVTTSEDRHGLSFQFQIGQGIVEPVIPISTRATIIGTGVPSGSTNDQTFRSGDSITLSIGNIDGFCSGSFGEISSISFGITREVEKKSPTALR